MKPVRDLEDLFLQYVQNLGAAETQVIEAMPALINKARHKSLRNALKHHFTISKKHHSRLSRILTTINRKKTAAKSSVNSEISFRAGDISKGMHGLIEEANEVLNQELDTDVIDAAIIGCVQKIEHYEICTYGTALAYATQLHLAKAVELLRKTLDEEYDADDLLTALATAALNKEAAPGHAAEQYADTEAEENQSSSTKSSRKTPEISISERTIKSPGGRAGTSHRRYPSGESRGH
jgi:ferritin-like metal-binding protein YciE